MANTKQHILTRNDSDLVARFIAQAEMMNIPNPQNWVTNNMSKLIAVDVEGTQSVADVYSYAREVREQYIENIPELPGQNLGAVTDEHLEAAIDAVLSPTP